MSTEERIWFADPYALVSPPGNLLKFFPLPGTPLAAQLNAAVRFAAYFAVILLLAGRSSRVLFIPIAVLVVTYLVYWSESNAGGEGYRSSTGLAADAQPLPMNSASGFKKPVKCTRPTRDNPFMNVLATEYGTRPKRGAACDIQDERVKGRVESLFEEAGPTGLVRDSDDIFHRRASSRQFVTNPATTIPNDQGAFANWLYGKPPTCKRGDRSACKYRT